MMLYALVGPVFTLVLIFLAQPGARVWGPVSVGGLIGLGVLWLWWRREPGTDDLIFPIAIVPTVSCGLAFVACGEGAPAFIGVMAAPLAWSAILCPVKVSKVAWVTASLTCLHGARPVDRHPRRRLKAPGHAASAPAEGLVSPRPCSVCCGSPSRCCPSA